MNIREKRRYTEQDRSMVGNTVASLLRDGLSA